MSYLENIGNSWRPIGEREAKLPEKVRKSIAEEEKRRLQNSGTTDRKVLVVGGSGYIGVPLINMLLSLGYSVRNVDISVYQHASAALGLFQHKDYEHVHGNICDPATRDQVLDGISDVVILAGLVGDPITKAFPEQSAMINDLGISALIEDLNNRKLNKVIFVSTCSNYGMISEDETACENHELKPLSLYAKSKVAAEQQILSLKGKVDYHPTILRFATAFGLAPRMRFDLTVNEFTRDIFLGKELEVYDANTWRPYCHVQDFSILIDRVLRFPVSEVSFEVFNAGGDINNHTKQSIVNLILDKVPAGKVSYASDSADKRNYKVDFSKVRSRLYFTPQYSIEDGIDEIISSMQCHVLDDVESRKNFYGNYALPGLEGQETGVRQ